MNKRLRSLLPVLPAMCRRMAPGLPLLLLLCLGCGEGGKKGAETRPPLDVKKLLPQAPEDPDPQPGGTFIWGRSGDATLLDPADVTDGESVMVVTNIFDTLVAFKRGSTEIEPSLATEWTTSPDKLVWTFLLREGATFHDGSPVDAEAVVFSFERQRDPAHPARRPTSTFSYYQNNFKALAKVEAVDARTVRFTLREPYAPFLPALALFNCSIVSPKAFASEGKDAEGRYKYNFAQKPVGSGPFVFESWEKDAHITLRANREYWGGAPHIGKLVFKPVVDPQTRLKELESGSIHGMENPELRDLEIIRRNPELRLLGSPGINVCYLAMHTGRKPFDDVRVRQAVAFAIDKKRIIAAAYDNMAEPAVSMCPKTMAGFDKSLIDRTRDVARAKRLLAAAGYADGFETSLWYPDIQRAYLGNPANTAIQIQADLKEIGIRVDIRRMEWSAILKATSAGEHEMCLMGWMADIFDPDNFLYVLLDRENAVEGTANNLSFYRGERVHELLLEAQRTYDWHRRERLYKEAQEILFEEAPTVPIATAPDFRALRADVRGYTIYPAGGEYFRHVSFAR
ncbi:MAG: ABC transporter substrate-binding protein [Planctomycetes bacterium]|nr:ABC transporter substrate-binding protein [Planctomycetota bacterium]